MSNDKQTEIEEMLEIIENAREVYANDVTDHTENEYIREGLLNANYRKASDLAEEIFAEIEKLIVRRMIPDAALIDDRLITDIAELKKKYTQGKAEIPPYVRMEAKALPATLNVKYTEEGK